MARSNAVGKLRDIVDAQGDVRTTLLRELGEIAQEKVLHGQVLVATHPGNKYHPGTHLLRTDKDLLESQYQGTVFLVLAVGPEAFTDNPKLAIRHQIKAEVGDWVLARPSDGMQLLIRQVPCRLFEDANIKMIVTAPEIFW